MNSSFVHLHVHTEYSLLDGAVRIPKLIKKCAENHMPALAITDNGIMYGVIDFYFECKAKGIKPIIGCEVYLTSDITVKKRDLTRLILLCKNYEGYQNLSELVSISHLQGFYYKPRIDLKHLAKYSDKLIAISPGMRGPHADNIKSNNLNLAKEYAGSLKEIFADDFYLGIQALGMPLEDIITDETIKMAKELDIPVVATNDVYYLEPEDALLREILLCLQFGKKLDESWRTIDAGQEQYFKNMEEMQNRFSHYPEALANTLKIADSCNIEFETDTVKLPLFDCPQNKSSKDYLQELVWEGVQKKYPEITDAVKNRVEFELDIINKMEYQIYFLIIHDFLQYCYKNNIPVGPGRGSAAGSIVSYALDITKIDPLKYNLLFERFLNPDRISMPDIDLDFCIKKRGEVIEYLVQKYGAAHVAQIVTFGTMQARAVIRDVGRVLDIPLNEVDRIAKLIPATPGHYATIKEAIEMVPELKKIYNSDPSYHKLLDYGSRLEGFARHSSTHAAGIVISREPLSQVVPLIKNEEQIATQFSMTVLEKIGLLKMDILGLRNLTVLEEAGLLIYQKTGEKIDLNNLPLDDSKTYSLLCSGQTAGIFQLESSGMRQLIKELKPTHFEDIVALLALYRPGPLGSGMVNEFVSNKSGKTKVKYEVEALAPILKDTYGMILYQEQVMQIASIIGGLSLGQADMLRRAMGKKKKSVMNKMRDEFVEGAQKKEIPETKAKKIFDLCKKFAEYGFNKSHSTAYAMISYQTAYIKANHPKEYMTALLSSVLGNSDKSAMYIEECKQMGIKVFPPSINDSQFGFSTNEKGIQFGMGAVKNVGEGAIISIIDNREKEKYTDLLDFSLKVDLRLVNKRVIESLIKSGAFDSLETNRGLLLSQYEKILEHAQSIAKAKIDGQEQLFSDMDNTSTINNEELDYEPLSKQKKLLMEKEMLGLYISGHPLEEIRDKLEAMPINSAKLSESDDNRFVDVIGLLSDCRKLITKNKREMIIAKLEDLSGSIPILVFENEKFYELAPLFQDDNIVKINGRVRVSQDEISLICNSIELIDDVYRSKQIHIDITHFNDIIIFEDIKNVCRQNRGEVAIYFHADDKVVLAHKKYWVTPDTKEKLMQVVGDSRLWEA